MTTEPPNRTCAAHGYSGFPPCPVPDCPNGHDRSLFVAYTVAGFGEDDTNYDNLEFGEGRYFHREKRNGVYQWIELAPTGNVYEAKR